VSETLACYLNVLYENSEIFVSPWLMEIVDGVGSGMRNLCRYGAEKSDSLVVLMKGPNNCRLWVGGGSGGKGRTLENTR
jgi:hypothetical protein